MPPWDQHATWDVHATWDIWHHSNLAHWRQWRQRMRERHRATTVRYLFSVRAHARLLMCVRLQPRSRRSSRRYNPPLSALFVRPVCWLLTRVRCQSPPPEGMVARYNRAVLHAHEGDYNRALPLLWSVLQHTEALPECVAALCPLSTPMSGTMASRCRPTDTAWGAGHWSCARAA